MCDCFHLAFPNWHASATGGGHRLKAPEQDTEDDLVCEEPEVLEGERPRPQGSSPVEEFPTTEKYVKQGEVDFYDSTTKSSKKGKKIGFGSLFDKRSSAKMNQTEDMQNDGSEMIVKSVKGGCAEGLVVSGGGKNGIFIKEVKPESPASKHLSVKEGDQILSATVFFDNVSYEDALQILEHSQPYRVEFCLKRKPVPTRTQEDAETMRPDVAIGEEAIGDEGTGPEMRGRRKSKKQHDRISWPKFPSLTKGRRAKFKRSHSTSEAEEQRKLEISPTTSDTESPLKSPLKSPDEKDKKKMNKIKLKKKMTGRRTKSVEETSENEELKTDDIEVLENHNIMNIAEEHSFRESVTNLIEISNTLDEVDTTIKTRNEFAFTTLPVTESLHRAELITLNNTLKTTDITVALGEERRERSEIKISIQGKDKSEIETESQLKSFSSGIRTSDPSIMNNIMTSPNIILQEDAMGHQVDSDIKLINQEIFEKTQGPEETDMKIPKIEVSNDVTDIELTKRSPRIGSDKLKKEINILEKESYGIRARGPLADMAISSHFVHKPDRLEFTSSDPFTFEIKTGQEMSSTIIDPKKPRTPTPVISQPKPHVQDIKISNLETDTAELTQKANIDAIIGDLGKISEAKFKLPKVDLSEFDHQESIAINLKRDDIEIPGREKKRSKSGFKPPKIIEPKIEKVIKIQTSKTGQAKGEEFNVDDVKKAVSKFPAFKLPERDITGVLVQREIAFMEMKTGLTPKGSPCKVSSMSTEISMPENTIKEVKQESSSIVTKEEIIILPKIELHLHDETLITESKMDQSKTKSKAQQSKYDKMLARDDKISTSPDVKFKLPKREDIEIPGMEAIEQSVQQHKIKVATETDTQDEIVKDGTDTDVTEKSNIKAVREGDESKSKKSKVSMPSFGIMKPDIRFPDIGIELPKKTTSSKSHEIKEVKRAENMSHDVTKQKNQYASIEFSKDQEPRDMKIEAVDDASEGTGLRLAKFGMSSPKQKKEGSGLVKGDGKTEVEPQAEIKEPESKMKKRKISFPKFGFSKSEIKLSDADITLPTEGSLQEGEAEVTEKDVESKTTAVEAEFQDSTDSPTKFRLPGIKLPKFGISFSRATDDRQNIQIADVSTEETTMDFKLPKGSGDLTALPDIKGPEIILIVSEPEAELSLQEKKEDTTGISTPKADIVYSGQEKEMKLSPEMLFSKPEVSLTGHEVNREVGVVELSKPDIKAFEVDVSVSQRDFSMPEGKMDESVALSRDEAEQKDLTIKFKLPSINLPKFGVKTSKVAKDLPMVDIDAEEPDVTLPEAQIIMKLKDDTPLDDIKESTEGIHLTTERNYEGHSVDMKIENVKPKEQGPTFKLAKFGISFSGVTDSDIDNSNLTIEGDTTLEAANNKVQVSYEEEKPEHDSKGLDIKIKTPSVSLPKLGFSKADFSLPKTDASKPAEIKDYDEPVKEKKESSAESEQAEKFLEGSPTKFKLPKIKFPKIGVSLPKTTAADHDKRTPGIPKEIKLPEAELSGDVLSVPKMDTHITLSLSKPEVDVSIKETEKIDNAPHEIKALSPEFKVGLVDHGPGQKPAIAHLTDGVNVQAQIIDTEVKYPSVTENADIPEDPEKESETKLKKLKISFPKIGFSKSETMVPDVNTSVQKEPISIPETEIKDMEVTFPDPELEVQLKTKSTTGSPSKFKLPTISLPKFNISSSKMVEESNAKADDVEKSKTEATSAAVSVSKDTETQYTEPSKVQFESLPGDAEIKTKEMDPESHASRFKMTKFEISFPKLKRSESKKGALKTVDTVEKPEGTLTHDMEMESQSVDGKIDVPEDTEVRMKKPKVQKSEYALSKHDIKAPQFGVKSDGVPMTTEEVDVNQPEHDIKMKTTGGSPLKFKLPTFKLPKFGISSSMVKPEVTDLGGEAQHLESEVLTSVEKSDGKIDITVPNQDLGFEQPNVDTADISILQMKPEFEEEVPDSKTMKTKKAGFSLPKLGFSKPDTKVAEIDVSVEQVDTSKPEGHVEVKDQIIDITVSKDDVEQKDQIIGSGTTKFKLPTINMPRIGGKADKEEKDMSDDDITVKGPDASCPDTQINISIETPSVDIREPHMVREGQTLTAYLNVEDTEIEGGKIKMPKFGIALPKTKGLDLGTPKTEDIAETNIIVKETPKLDVSVQKPDISISEGGVNTTETNIDIMGSKVESDQKGSTIFGSPTKFKLPSFSFPKFGVKSQKAALDIKVKDLEIEATNTKIESFQQEVTLEVHPSNIDIQDGNTKKIADMPAADSKGLEAKVKRPSFSFPKLGFSKPNITTPELDASVQKIDASIPEKNLDLPDQIVEMTLPEVRKEDEQKDLTVAGSPTKFKLPAFNLPNFGLKTSKGTVNLSSELSVPEPEIQVSAQIRTIDTDIRAKEIDVSATINETNIHLEEGRIIPPSIDADMDAHDISIKGKADIHVVDSKDLDMKVKKPSFSLPKLGFSKPDIEGQETDVSLLKTEMSVVEGNITVEDQGTDIIFTGELNEQEPIGVSQMKFKMPLISLPKMGMKYPKAGADIPTADLDIKEPEISFPETGEIEMKTSMDIEGSSAKVDVKPKETDIDGLGGKFKLPKFGIGMQKVKETEMEGKEKEVQQPICEIKDVTIEKKVVEMDSKVLEISFPEIGSKQELKAPEVDVSLPKVDTGISMEIADVSHQSADITSPTRFKLPTFHFPKFGIKASKGKVDSPTTNVDIKGAKLSLPDENINISDEAPSVDINDPTTNAEDISIVSEAKTGDIETDIKSPEGETDMTRAKFGSPTKFKLPTIKLPKFGISIPKVTASTPKADVDILDTKVNSVDKEVETPKMDSLDDIKVKTAVIETKSFETNIEAKGTQEGQESKFKLSKFEVMTGAPETGITEPEIKIPAEDVSVPRVDTALPEGSVSIIKPEETELKVEKATSGSPSKFKFPSFKMPKFGISAHKSSDIKAEVTEVDAPDIKTDLNVEDKPIYISKDIHIEGEIKETTEQAPEAVVQKKDGNKGSPSKFKLPSIKMPKMNISRTKSQDEDDATIKASAPEMKEEDEKIKVDDLQGPDKSPKFTMPAIGDVFKGFEVEFNVPALEETEAKKEKPSGKIESESGDKTEESPEHKNKGAQDKSRFKFKFPKLGFSQSSDDSDKLADARFEESEKHVEPPANQKEEGDKEAKTEKGGWFKFSKFSSPTKTAKVTEKEIIQPTEAAERSQINDDVEEESKKEPEKSPMSEIEEENISPTLSLRSSEAFADISSTLTTEHIAPSQTFPTRVKVKYAEPTATVGVNDTKVQSDVVTSTARCELISMEPHQPEKVNIPFSSDASSPSGDTFKQMSGEIHVITSNIQAISDTQQVSILTNLEAPGIHTSPIEVTQISDSVLTVEETRVQSKTHTLVERHVVKETLGDGKETILVTHTTRVLEGDAAEPISDETSSSFRRLRDTVHTEKMRFFDSVATTEEVRVTSSEISIRHMDSSTDDNGGK
ncbi:neuroblast differentiation-associated protein AHNAK-like [Triplophysa dalaica]|uniref:neuroblast differentiation-associated protein AHNAK-like n=1 Tax=Triplophysa dalaica TaxID=1582913 RepID=UPI0024DFEF04|nr:neuroblast differentiation-associated protein AHNAK-like [Triplophysa dalaica]